MGDAHVGFRENDNPDLARWAKKQRMDQTQGELSGEKAEQLEVRAEVDEF